MMKGTPFQHKPTLGGGIMLNVSTELGKLLSVVTDEVAPYDTRSNASDFNSMPWGDDAGFIIAIVPATISPESLIHAKQPNKAKKEVE